jgi:hypothetical protein
MSSAQEKHPIISHLEIIEQCLDKIEKAPGITDESELVLRKRTIL